MDLINLNNVMKLENTTELEIKGKMVEKKDWSDEKGPFRDYLEILNERDIFQCLNCNNCKAKMLIQRWPFVCPCGAIYHTHCVVLYLRSTRDWNIKRFTCSSCNREIELKYDPWRLSEVPRQNRGLLRQFCDLFYLTNILQKKTRGNVEAAAIFKSKSLSNL